MTRVNIEQQPLAADGMNFLAELEMQNLRHGGAGRSVYSVLVTGEACAEFWGKYAADLKNNAACNVDSTCVEFARRCQDAWLDVFRNRLAKEDAKTPRSTTSKRNGCTIPSSPSFAFSRRQERADPSRRTSIAASMDWDEIAGAFEHALTALTEAGPEFEKALELYGRRDEAAHGLRAQLERAKEAGTAMRDHLLSVSSGPRTQARRFAYALARSCEAAPAIPRPSLAQICTLIRLLYGQGITPQEVGSAIRSG